MGARLQRVLRPCRLAFLRGPDPIRSWSNSLETRSKYAYTRSARGLRPRGTAVNRSRLTACGVQVRGLRKKIEARRLTNSLEKRMWTRISLFLVVAATGVCAHAARGGHFSLRPIAANGPHVAVGTREIRLIGGGQQVTVELNLSNWGPEVLRGWQARILATGYENGVGEPLAPAHLACTTNVLCVNQLGPGSECAQGTCAAGFIDLQHPDFVFSDAQSCGIFVAASSIMTLNYSYYAAADPTCLQPDGTDDGEIKYGGTLVLAVPIGAVGVYDVGFLETETFMINVANVEHGLHTFDRLRIVIVGDDNGDGAISAADHRGLAQCMSGPQESAPPGCESFDFDGAMTVDLADFAHFLNVFTGP